MVITQVKHDMEAQRCGVIEREADQQDHGVGELSFGKQEDNEEAQERPKFAELLGGIPESVCWAMTARKVHVLPAADEPPWCARKKGSRAKKLTRVAASGTGVELLVSLGVEDQVDLCTDCLVAISK